MPAEIIAAQDSFRSKLSLISALVSFSPSPAVVRQQEEPAEEGGARDAGGRRRRVVVGPVGVAQVRPEAHQGLALSTVINCL